MSAAKLTDYERGYIRGYDVADYRNIWPPKVNQSAHKDAELRRGPAFWDGYCRGYNDRCRNRMPSLSTQRSTWVKDPNGVIHDQGR